MMWFENSYRRHLLDMHINAQDGAGFLSQFDPDAYLENLLLAHVDNAMIYLQSHVGYCYYPTRVGHVHPAFADRPDAMKALIDGCRARGIRVVVYYSLIYNRTEAIDHPGWRLTSEADDGREFSGKRYLHCCPNSKEYLAFTLAQLKEIYSYADFDGIFFDMPFWPKICHCANCKSRLETEYGKAVPESEQAPDFREFARIRDSWLNEFLGEITAFCKSLDPDVTVEYNLASAALPGERMPGEGVIALSDFASGDLYRGALAHSFACKLYSAVTRNQPFECMTSRCPNLKAHTLTRSRDQLRLSLSTVLAHHGANFVIDAIDPMGTMDRRFYEELGELYREMEPYEKYLKTGEPAADVGLLFSLEGKYAAGDMPCPHYRATLGAAEALTKAHIPYGLVTQATLDRLPKFRCIVAAGVSDLSLATADALRQYVLDGGCLYFSGGNEEKLLSFVGEPAGRTSDGYSYLAQEPEGKAYFEGFTPEYPLPVGYDLPVVQTDREVLARITLPYETNGSFASIHSNPPGTPTRYPAVIRMKMGKGTVIWCAASIEAEKSIRIRQVFTRILSSLCKGFRIRTDAPEQVETVIFSAEAETLVSFIFQTDDETIPPVSAFSVTLSCDHEVTEATLLPYGTALPFSRNGREITFSLALPDGFAMIRLA